LEPYLRSHGLACTEELEEPRDQPVLPPDFSQNALDFRPVIDDLSVSVHRAITEIDGDLWVLL